jgi:hypothetical protein
LNDTFDTLNQANFECNVETNFNTAMKISGEFHDYETIMRFLQSDKIVEKQIAALELTEVRSAEDAEILLSNLVGQDGKIREAVAFKINELAQNPQNLRFFISEKNFGKLIEGIMDINGNVCRQIVNSDFFNVDEFRNYLCNKLPEIIAQLLEEIEKIDKMSRQYVISKRNFQLYWSLEALFNIIEFVDLDRIENILQSTANFRDYTIREKTAKILTKLDKLELSELKEKLRNDKNYYVRRYLN